MFEWLTHGFSKDSGDAQERGPVTVQGHQLRCAVCSNQSFRARQVRLDIPMRNLLDLDAWNGMADCAICDRCGHIHWFVTSTATQESGAVTPEPDASGAT